MKTITIAKDIRMKDGSTILAGTSATFVRNNAGDRNAVWNVNGVERTLSYRGLFKAPGIRTLEKWSNDGIAKTPFGARTEPDGHGPNNEPSWLLVLGMI